MTLAERAQQAVDTLLAGVPKDGGNVSRASLEKMIRATFEGARAAVLAECLQVVERERKRIQQDIARVSAHGIYQLAFEYEREVATCERIATQLKALVDTSADVRSGTELP